MENSTFEKLQSYYAPVINRIINSNNRFYSFQRKIRWGFGYDERVAIVAWCDKVTNILTINICSVDFAINNGQPLMIEYFLLHEIRHIFQYIEIADYKTNPDLCVNINLAKKWAEENEKYVGALKENGEENQSYFAQDMEFDAFAFSFAVMKYKYGNIPYIEKPKAYGQEFDDTVEEWCEAFRAEGL